LVVVDLEETGQAIIMAVVDLEESYIRQQLLFKEDVAIQLW
jgi:hypothetical protein